MPKQTIASILAANAEMKVEAVEGTIRSVGKFIYVPEGAYGPYSYQYILLEDGGRQLRTVFKNRPEVPQSDIGKFIAIVGAATKLRANRQSGQPELELAVTDKSAVTPAVQVGAPASQPPPPNAPAGTTVHPPSVQQPQPPPPRSTTAAAPTPPQATVTASAGPRPYRCDMAPEQCVTIAKDYLQRVGNFYQLAMEEAHFQRRVWNKRHPKFPMPDAQFEKMVAGFCQGGDKYYIPPCMPVGELASFLEPVGDE